MRSRIVHRAVAILVGLIGIVGLCGLAAGTAHAEGEAIRGTLRDGFTNEPVAGVTITVSNDSGFEESTVTDAEGAWIVEVPEPGE